MEETFNYRGVILKKAEAPKDGGCRGCYFDTTGISCIPKDVPECGKHIFVLAEQKE